MSEPLRFEDLDPEARAEFCGEILERLSDLVHDEAPEEFCARVAELLGECQPLHAFRRTLAATIDLAGEAGRVGPSTQQFDDEQFAACIERVRGQIQAE